MLKITEFCLQGKFALIPFAVLVERDLECGWGIATSSISSPGWIEHVASSKERRDIDAWVFECWSQWLSDITCEPPEARHALVQAIATSSPGIVVRRPKALNTSLTASVVAKLWEVRRLHNRADSLAARIARRLSKNQKTYWSSELKIKDGPTIQGTWIVECQPRPGRDEMRQPAFSLTKSAVGLMPTPKLVTTASDGLAVIRVIDVCEISEVMSEWERQKSQLGIHYPYGIAVVQKHRGARVSDVGCVVGDRFAAPETLAVAATRTAWSGVFPLPSAFDGYIDVD